MTSCSSVLALGMMPLLLYVYCQGFPDLVNVVPYGRIIIALVLTIIPCGIGILITHYRPHWTKSASRVGTHYTHTQSVSKSKAELPRILINYMYSIQILPIPLGQIQAMCWS